MQQDATTGRWAPVGDLVLGLAGLAWLTAMLVSARATITGRVDAETEVTATAYALPGAVSASLVAGAAVALAALATVARTGRWGGRLAGRGARFAVATGCGLVVGLLGAVAVVTVNSEGWVYAVLGGTVAAAATIGGALAGFPVPRVVTALCWGALAVLAWGFVVNLFQDPLLGVFGAGDDQLSRLSAARRFTLAQAAVGGLVAGLVGYAVLRRARARAEIRWPLYALAGGGPGLLLLVTEGLARTAGARVLDLAGRVSLLEQTVQRVLADARLNSALVVLFVGAVTAIVAVGRTLGPPAEGPAPEPAAAPTD